MQMVDHNSCDDTLAAAKCSRNAREISREFHGIIQQRARLIKVQRDEQATRSCELLEIP